MIQTSLTPPAIDQATIDHYVAKGRRERSLAFWSIIGALFTGIEVKATAKSAQPFRAYPA